MGLNRLASAVLAVALLLGGATIARAGLRPDAQLGQRASFTLVTTKGHTRAVEELRGRVVIIAYEGRASRRVNKHVKKALERLLRGRRELRRRVAVLPVSNVAAYDFWPARYFARAAVEKIAKRRKMEIWFDWHRSLQKRLGMRDDSSNFAVLDRQGRLRYHRWGRFSPKGVRELIAVVKKLARGPTPQEK